MSNGLNHLLLNNHLKANQKINGDGALFVPFFSTTNILFGCIQIKKAVRKIEQNSWFSFWNELFTQKKRGKN